MATPPLRHDVRAEVVFMAKDENGLPCGHVDDSVARYHAGFAANRPPPIGLGAQDGQSTDVQYPAPLPSP